MVVSLVDALVVLDLAQLSVVGDVVVSLPCRRRFVSSSTKRMANDIAIPLSPFPCPQTNMRKRFEERAVTCSKNECAASLLYFWIVRNQKPGGRGASRAGAIEDDRDGRRRWFGVHPIRLGTSVSINIIIYRTD